MMRILANKKITIISLCCCIAFITSAQNTIIKNKNLAIEVNDDLQTKVNTRFNNAKPLTNGFSSSEYIQTKYFTAKNFHLTKKEKNNIKDAAGNGVEWKFFGSDNINHIDKILSIKTYNNFPDAAYFNVQYINKSNKELPVIKWVNNEYNVLPSSDTTAFWSFQGSSHADRRDWVQKVNRGFHEKNFMGMNASDYGGGIPVIDLWRKDAGIAVGNTETVAKLVSLPIDFDQYADASNMSLQYQYPEREILQPNDTLHTFETFVSVHERDCFATLRNFSNFMQTKGIKPATTEPAAFEPIWCAWGYERDFTLKEILNTLPKVKELGFKWVGLDDGYQQAEGDWHTNKEHFPGGDEEMKAFIDSIHAQGMKAVLWWAPMAADPGSKVLKTHPDILLQQENGAPQYITWWDAYYMSPTDKAVIEETRNTVKMFMQDWGFDALKLDGQYMNACAPDYGGHNIDYPEQSFEKLPLLFKEIYETAKSIKPDAVIEFCPCGDVMNFYHMPYTNQFVASDPTSSWQVRLKNKIYKALMPQTAYFGDHVELTDTKEDFASQIGIGAVPGTKFVYPATGVKSKDENLLTPEKEKLFEKWMNIYNEKMLSKSIFRGDLYDIGYDDPETYCIQKGDTMYYSFYNADFNGTVELRGLDAKKKYAVYDYVNDKKLGTVNGSNPQLQLNFKQSLLIEVYEVK
ncbi:glycoside hydrolase family 36 protein [Parafilimonas sp.]|uniref:glycoside hydrolase family 36 protein n=1 Tax=Parafilimonas sp. TaxID=1969739 RepID=UPI003F817518